MTQYLITLSATLDDMPVRLFNTEDEAVAFVREARQWEFANKGPHAAVTSAYDVARRDGPSDPNGYDVWKLVDGKPVDHVCCWYVDPPPVSPLFPVAREETPGGQ